MFEWLDGREKRSAIARLNSYRRQIRTWQRQAEELPNYGRTNMPAVKLADYLDYDEWELEGFETADELAESIEARRALIAEKVSASQDRFRMQHPPRRTGRVGRPRQERLLYGQHVYLVTVFNHGQGALFSGYVAEVATDAEPTHIEEWGEY